MEMKLDSPAARLHSILSDLVQAGKAEPAARMQALWQKVLKTDATPELLVRVGKVYAMPGEIARAMPNTIGYHRIDVDRWWVPLSQFFIEAHMGAVWGNVRSHLGGNLLRDIESCAVKLSAFVPEPQLDETLLSGLEAQLADLLHEVIDSNDISESTKKKLIDRIRRIQDAMQNIWLDGTERLTTELRATVEVVITTPEARTSESGSTIQRFGKWVGIALTTLQIWNAANTAFPQLPDIFDVQSPPAIEAPRNPTLPEGEVEPEEDEDIDVDVREV